MPNHHHQSPVLVERPSSPPHLRNSEPQPPGPMAPVTSEVPEPQILPPPEHSDPLPESVTSSENHPTGEQTNAQPSTTAEESVNPAPPGNESESNAQSGGLDHATTQSAQSEGETVRNTSVTDESSNTTTQASDQNTQNEQTSHNQEGSTASGQPVENITEVSPEAQSATSVNGDTPVPPTAGMTSETSSSVSEAAPVDHTPAWVQYEEDLSVPDEDELKDIVAAEVERPNAGNIKAMEDQLFTDLDDPEQRPCKKLRMSWIIKGVRGTRERPNMAKVMNSPAVCVDGLYWSIKFYPRGDNCGSLSAFVRCSRIPPKQVDEMPEYTFSCFEGPPDADFSVDYEPTVNVAAPNTLKVWEKPRPAKKESAVSEGTKKPEGGDNTAEERPWTPVPDDDDANDCNDDTEYSDVKDWRVSAQLGMAIYNPAETRTSHHQSDGHQFSKNCDDWGWVNFVPLWEEVHKRKPGQRRPLLQNDQLAIDAYIRIFDDPTEALWWHDSKIESQWPSKQLAGFYPMGTPALYHSPAVAAIAAWTLLAPFRKVVQAHDGYKWRQDAAINPTPLICQTQLVLHQMRNLVGDCYVSVHKIIEELTDADEPWEDVKSFWEVYRRGLELELETDSNLAGLASLRDMFDADGKRFEMPSLPVVGISDVSSGLTKHFDETKFKGNLPNFMPVMLNRQQFDQKSREWKLYQDRVRLNDELDLSSWSSETDAKYTLYGFVVHVGSRNSGKFYSVLRPGGIGSKWLAFEDGNGNKVFSYTKKRIQEFEGLEGDDLKNFTGEREKAYMAMYIRTSCWQEYLPKAMEPFILPRWLRPWVDGPVEVSKELEEEEAKQVQAAEQKQAEEGTEVVIYLDESVKGLQNVLDLHDIRKSPPVSADRQTIMVAADKTCAVLRSKIAEAFEVSDVSKIALWEIGYRSVGRYSRAELDTVSWRRKVKRHVQPGEILQIWLTVLPHEGRKESYQALLPKLADMGLDQKAPASPAIDEVVEGETQGESASAESTQENPPVAEQSSSTSNLQTVDASSSNTDGSTTSGGIATPATGDTADSPIDIEQTSVAEAVARDVQQVSHPTTHAGESAVSAAPATDNDNTSNGTTPTVTTTTDVNQTSPIPDTPLEHSHLVEAAQTPEPAVAPTENEQTTNAEVHGPTPDDEISAEDAAAIAALLAADAAENAAELAASPGGEASDNLPDQAQPAVSIPEPVQERAATPDPLHVYGFLLLFDAEKQQFIAQAPFNPVIEHEIGPSVRKAFGYSDDKEIRIWRRDGPAGTSPITGSSTFVGSGFQDGFILIVGDILSETKVDALKQAGNCWQPAQLIKRLLSTRRRHPILSRTSIEPVEIAEFGGDYFKGPIIQGQPHGDNCTLITATGHTYEGSLVAGLKSGANGKMTYQNGDVYTGEWFNDERHGKGEYVEARTGNRYVGGYENGKRWGEGVTYWKVADEQAAMCQICYGEEIDALFFDCGHVCACVECAERQRDNGCPICRKPVRQVVKMYRA